MPNCDILTQPISWSEKALIPVRQSCFGYPVFCLFILIFLNSGCTGDHGTTQIKSHGELLSLNGAELFVKVIGKGPPVIVIHGGPGFGHRYLYDHLTPLKNDFSLIFYDQRASGASSAELESSELTLANFVSDIEAIREYFKFEKVNLIAHSFGGLLAMKYAAEYPEYTDRLILIGSISLNSNANNQANTKLANSFSARDLDKRVTLMRGEAFRNGDPLAFEELMKIGFKYQFYDTTKVDLLSLDLPQDFFAKSQVLGGLFQDLTNYNFNTELSNITAPVLLIYGESDPLLRFAYPEIAENLINFSEISFSKSGHFPFIEERDKSLRSMNAFLND